MNEYTEYDLRHWEDDEFDTYRVILATNGTVSLTPEALAELMKRFSPVGYREGEITLDIPISSFLRFWEELGGEYAKR